jgi:hypothetical protein
MGKKGVQGYFATTQSHVRRRLLFKKQLVQKLAAHKRLWREIRHADSKAAIMNVQPVYAALTQSR